MSTENLVLDEVVTGSPTRKDDQIDSVDVPDATEASTSRPRSRSRSPRPRQKRRSPVDNKDRQGIYERDGTNTTSDLPHMQRARLFVGNIPHGLDRNELRRTFRRYGNVHGVSIHKGFAFVQMDMEKHANDAILGEDGAFLKGSRLEVEFSQAAKKAGARLIDKRFSERKDRSPNRFRQEERFDDLDAREAKLSRMLAMERELQMLRYGRNDPYDRREYSKDYDRPRDYERSVPGGYNREYRTREYDRPPVKEYGRDMERRSYYDPAVPSSVSPPPRKFPRNGPGETGVGYGTKPSEPAPLGWPSGGYNKPTQRPWSSEQWH